MDEFSLIAKYFKPLAASFAGSLNLSDDAAIISPPENCELVITKDAISQGIHFIGSEDPALIAAKALRVNLSDLAAMGATPLCYFLALMLPKNTSKEWLEKFVGGLKETQEKFSIKLAGGDTTSTEGRISISITAIGSVPTGKALRRSGAKIGDDIYVSGTLGDAALGLELLQKEEENDFFINRYLLPQPRIDLGMALREIASSAMDISDGLVQDLGHICTASNVGAVIYSDKIPTTNNQQLITALSGGDDYELIFTAPPDKKQAIEQISTSLNLPLTIIGNITNGKSLTVLDKNNNIIQIDKKGFSHF